MTYSSNHTNRATIFDAGDAIDGDHVKSLYDELGSDPSGASADVTARLTALDSTVAGKAATSHSHATTDITSGTMATARLGSGTANSTTFLRGDNTWATPAGGGTLALPYLLVAAQDAPAGMQAVADYVCDGTNDEVQINAALTAAASDATDANYPGWNAGHVVLTAGRFNISSAILMNTGNWLSGQGVMTELRAVSNTATGTGSGTYAAVIKAGATTAHMFQISDLWLYGNYASGGACHAIGITSTSGATRTFYPDFSPDPNVHIHDLFISGFKGSAGRNGIFVDTDWRGTIIDRLQMRHFTGDGIYFNGSPDSHISNVHLGTCDGNGYRISGGNVKLVNCKAYYCDTRGFYITSGRGSAVACESQDNAIGYEFTSEPFAGASLVADTCSTDGIIVATNGIQLNGFQIFTRSGGRYATTTRGLTISGTRTDCTIIGAVNAANITTKISGSVTSGNRNFMRVSDDATLTSVN